MRSLKKVFRKICKRKRPIEVSTHAASPPTPLLPYQCSTPRRRPESVVAIPMAVIPTAFYPRTDVKIPPPNGGTCSTPDWVRSIGSSDEDTSISTPVSSTCVQKAQRTGYGPVGRPYRGNNGDESVLEKRKRNRAGYVPGDKFHAGSNMSPANSEEYHEAFIRYKGRTYRNGDLDCEGFDVASEEEEQEVANNPGSKEDLSVHQFKTEIENGEEQSKLRPLLYDSSNDIDPGEQDENLSFSSSSSASNFLTFHYNSENDADDDDDEETAANTSPPNLQSRLSIATSSPALSPKTLPNARLYRGSDFPTRTCEILAPQPRRDSMAWPLLTNHCYNSASDADSDSDSEDKDTYHPLLSTVSFAALPNYSDLDADSSDDTNTSHLRRKTKNPLKPTRHHHRHHHHLPSSSSLETQQQDQQHHNLNHRTNIPTPSPTPPSNYNHTFDWTPLTATIPIDLERINRADVGRTELVLGPRVYERFCLGRRGGREEVRRRGF